MIKFQMKENVTFAYKMQVVMADLENQKKMGYIWLKIIVVIKFHSELICRKYSDFKLSMLKYIKEYEYNKTNPKGDLRWFLLLFFAKYCNSCKVFLLSLS